MARKQKDLFGFEELGKTFSKLEDKYKNQAERLLETYARQAQKRAKQLSPQLQKPKERRKKGDLKRSIRHKKPKAYKNGKTLVALLYSAAPHGHLLENDHKMYTPLSRQRKYSPRKTPSRLIGVRKGDQMIAKAIKESESRFGRDAQGVLEKLSREFEE